MNDHRHPWESAGRSGTVRLVRVRSTRTDPARRAGGGGTMGTATEVERTPSVPARPHRARVVPALLVALALLVGLAGSVSAEPVVFKVRAPIGTATADAGAAMAATASDQFTTPPADHLATASKATSAWTGRLVRPGARWVAVLTGSLLVLLAARVFARRPDHERAHAGRTSGTTRTRAPPA